MFQSSEVVFQWSYFIDQTLFIHAAKHAVSCKNEIYTFFANGQIITIRNSKNNSKIVKFFGFTVLNECKGVDIDYSLPMCTWGPSVTGVCGKEWVVPLWPRWNMATGAKNTLTLALIYCSLVNLLWT